MLTALKEVSDDTFIGEQLLSSGHTAVNHKSISFIRDSTEHDALDFNDEDKRLAFARQVSAELPPPQAPLLDLKSIDAKLRSLPPSRIRSLSPRTPSSSSSDTDNEIIYDNSDEAHRAQEKTIRDRLVAEGCIPCHPPTFTYPYDEPSRQPTAYPASMFYIHKRGEGTGDEPLDYQLSDWLLFRATQKRVREEFQDKAKKSKNGDTTTSLLTGYMSDSRDRLGVDRPWTESADLIDWSYDVESQSQIQNWLEFLTWHVGRHKLLQRQGRIRIQRARRAQNHEWQEQYERRLLELHDAMLVWMEEQRVAMSVAVAAAEKEKVESVSTAQPSMHLETNRSSLDKNSIVSLDVPETLYEGFGDDPSHQPTWKRKADDGEDNEKPVIKTHQTRLRQRSKKRERASREELRKLAEERRRRTQKNTWRKAKTTSQKKKTKEISKTAKKASTNGTTQKETTKKPQKPQKPQKPPLKPPQLAASPVITRSGRQSRKPERYS